MPKSETKSEKITSSEENTEVNLTWDKELLKELSELRGCSGHEDKVREYIKNKISPLCDEIKVDTMGNLYGIKNGKNRDNCVVISAHMDEIGFMIRFIDKEGFLRLAPIGVLNHRLLPGMRVIVNGKNGDVPGIFGEKAIHLMERNETNKVTQMEDLFIDIGVNSKTEALKLVDQGDYAEFNQIFQEFASKTRINAKSLDNRAGCYVLIKNLELLKEKNIVPENTIVFAFCVQEELGVRGSIVAAYKWHPLTALVIDVTHPFDYPNVSMSKFQDLELGKGPVIAIGPNIHPKITQLLIKLAKDNNIPYQIETEPEATSTDARSFQVSREGIPVGLLTIPLRYMHSMIETIDIKDLEQMVKLVSVYIQNNNANLLN
jgi:putative aminopeptidase FrvX